jgi:DNA repair exonuclease SbcCD ATPase subunit
MVIQGWLAGEQRDKIAVDNGLSAGAVTNIVNEWRQALGFHLADALRDLAVALKRVGITPAQCALGFRAAMMLNRLGVKEDNFESFMSDVYNRCCNIFGLVPERIAFYITNLLEFSQTVPLSQIPEYIQLKRQEKEKLEQEIQILEEKVKKLQKEKSDSERLCNSALEESKITKESLKWYSDIKEELEKRYGIPVDDISKLGAIVNQVSQLFGYDASKVVYALSNLESLKAEHAKYQTWIQEVKTDYYGLSQEKSELQNVVASCKQSLSVYNQLAADMNFGLKELKLLWNTILEIAAANNIPREQAVSKFFKDIEQQYDDKLGFESKIDKLQVEVNKLNRQELRLLGEINAIPRLGLALLKLFNMNDDNNNNNNIDEVIELLIDKVRKSGGIKAAIKKLSQPIDEEEKQEVLVDGGNKSSGNKQIEKQEGRVEVREEDSHDEEDASEVELRHLFEEATGNMPPQDTPEEPLFWKSE